MFLWSLFATFSTNLLDAATAGFEVPPGSLSPFKPPISSQGIMPLDPDSFLPPGWKTVGAQKPAVLWIKSGSEMLGKTLITPHALLFVDLTSYRTKPTPVAGVGDVFGGVELVEPIQTEPGKQYQLSFVMGTREDHAGMSGPIAVMAVMGSGPGLVKGFVHSREKGVQMKWTRHDYIFNAISNRTPLTIWGLGYGPQRSEAGVDDDCELIALDDVGIRKVTVLGRVLDFFTRVLRFFGLLKTAPQFDPTLHRP